MSAKPMSKVAEWRIFLVCPLYSLENSHQGTKAQRNTKVSALSCFLLIITIIFNCLNRDMQDEWMNRMIEDDGIQF